MLRLFGAGLSSCCASMDLPGKPWHPAAARQNPSPDFLSKTMQSEAMPMRLPASVTNLLLVLVGVAVLGAVYYYYYFPTQTEITMLQLDTDSLRPRLQSLETLMEGEDAYPEYIHQQRVALEAEMASYPSDIRPEDILMYTAVTVEQQYNFTIQTVSFDEPQLLRQFTLPAEGQERTVSAYAMEFMLQGNFQYSDLKDFLRSLPDDPMGVTLGQFHMSYIGANGVLGGTIHLKTIFLSDETQPRTPTLLPELEYGLDELFGSRSGD